MSIAIAPGICEAYAADPLAAGTQPGRSPERRPSAVWSPRVLHTLRAATLIAAVALIAAIGCRLHEIERTLTGVQNRQNQLAQPVTDPLIAHVRRAAGSVFLVALRNDTGDLTDVGTAWAIAEDTLATNAHVAEALQAAMQTGAEPIVRNTATGDNFAVEQALLHPGYEQWASLANGAVLQSTVLGLEQLEFVPVCDVALLKVDAQLEPLPIASAGSLADSTGGQRVAYVGFPSENIPGSRLNAPPAAVFGHLTSVTTFFFERAGAENGLLLHHDLAAAGGASGSPILNERGEVIGLLSAGSVVMTEGGRAPVGFNFAQRVDLAMELLDGSANAAQKVRNAEWLRALDRLTRSPRERLTKLAERMVKDWISEGILPAHASAQVVDVRQIERGEVHTTQRVRLPGPGAYGVLATSGDWADLDLVVLSDNGVLGSDQALDGLPYVWFEIEAEAEITIELLGTDLGPGDAETIVQIVRIGS